MLVVEDNVAELVLKKLNNVQSREKRWVESYAVEFEVAKTEAHLFSEKRRHWSGRLKGGIRVRCHKICSTREATKRLEIWIDSHLALKKNHRRRIKQARAVESHLIDTEYYQEVHEYYS
jgi:hypothetical protein